MNQQLRVISGADTGEFDYTLVQHPKWMRQAGSRELKMEIPG